MTDAAGSFIQGDIPDRVEAVLNVPMGANHLSAVGRRELYSGQVVGGLLVLNPGLLASIEPLGAVLDFDQGTEVVVPGLGSGFGWQGPESSGAPLKAGMAADFMGMMLLLRRLPGIGAG